MYEAYATCYMQLIIERYAKNEQQKFGHELHINTKSK